MQVREAREPELLQLVQVCDTLMDCVHMQDLEEVQALVLETEQRRLVGFALHRKVENGTQIDRLFVHRVFRGKGYGKQLLQNVMQREKEHGNFSLQVHVNNVRARSLYESCGFSETDRFGDYIQMYTSAHSRLYCYCKRPDDHEKYVECSGEACPFNNWVHVKCGGDPKKQPFWCSECVECTHT